MSFAAPFTEPEELAALIRDKSKIPGKDYVVIDVRDKDFPGGNIPGAVNVPAHTLLDQGNALIEQYRDVPRVFFHCALSQQRGPKSARIYRELRHHLGIRDDQKVTVLRGGFDGWHAKYARERDLLENYQPAMWGLPELEEQEETEEENPFLKGIPKH